MGDPRRRKKGFFDDFDDVFGGDIFDADFQRRMTERINRFMHEAIHEGGQIDPATGKSYVWGFSMHSGPDGKPIVEEFGNVADSPEILPGEREPLVDVINSDDGISVIAELPGVDKADIGLKADAESLSIKVDTEDRKYAKELRMPEEIDPDNIKASYKNGILEVKLKPVGVKKTSKKDIKID